MKSTRIKWSLGVGLSVISLYLVLLIRGPATLSLPATSREAFAWNRDEYWSALESKFAAARLAGCGSLEGMIAHGLSSMDSLCACLNTDTLSPQAPVFVESEREFFELTVQVAACPSRVREYVHRYSQLRTALKEQSLRWDMNSIAARDCIYRLLYGGRTAVEEVIQQAPKGSFPQVVLETDEPLVTPSAVILGVTIHSGDILVSRGGAPTSALIARGNDYPGNFSHVALVYVDESSGVVSIIESHIEKGVAIATVEDYLKDTKLRVMVLRVRSDLPAMQADPMLPHHAAKYLLERAKAEHIPYDFAMNTRDDSKMFCSEVVSGAYRHCDVRLWAGLSNISSVGARSWLSAFGVRNFITEEPSDLEYDPQLSVVAEWRDYNTLYKDRLDNAVVDVMLESADHGARLQLDWYMLPVARMLKAYSVVMNECGLVGPVPEGMSAVAALRNKWFTRQHRRAVERLTVLSRQFEQRNGYTPPYWEMIKLARQACGAAPTP